MINPFYYGYRFALILVLFLFLQAERTFKLLDRNTIYLLLFGFIYQFSSVNSADSVETSLISVLPDVFLPASMYIVGKGVSMKYGSADTRIFFMFFIQLFFSVIPIFSILEQVLAEGFTGNRSLYLVWDRSTLVSATGLGAYFSINMGALALFNTNISSRTHKNFFVLIFLLFLLSTVCVFRLGNRTQLFIVGLTIAFSYLFNFRNMSVQNRLWRLVLYGLVIAIIGGLFFAQSEVVNLYQDRLGDSEAGEANLGGRLERWQLAFDAIFTDPWGWSLSKFGYAHNLWLDVVRVSGILAVIPLLWFSISAFKLFLKALKVLDQEKFLSTYILVFFVSIGLMFFIEPIMEGMYLLFFLFCLFIGFLSGICSRNKALLYRQKHRII